MEPSEYRKRGKEMVDFVADYVENVRSRRVFPDVHPGYMREMVPNSVPEYGEKWEDIFGDIECVIMPGITHWASPSMHAYYPLQNCFASMLAEMAAEALNINGFTWAASPACTELEVIVLDWLGELVGLPEHFLHSGTGSTGGGVIASTVSEASFVALLAARAEAVRRISQTDPDIDSSEISGHLVAYCSDQAHSSIEKATLMAMVKLRRIPSDGDYRIDGVRLREAMESDINDGLIPFYLCATLGTTGSCAFDDLKTLGPICAEKNVWLHVDAAYAGAFFACPEFRTLMTGIEFADSFVLSTTKGLLTSVGCCPLWVRDCGALNRTFSVSPLYLRHENTGSAIDYMVMLQHWQIGLSHRFDALKLWFVLRTYGRAGIQKHVRKMVAMAELFETLARNNPDFRLHGRRFLGLVVFSLKGDNELTEKLLKRLNRSGQLHVVPATLHGQYIIRFVVTSPSTTQADIWNSYSIICTTVKDMLQEPKTPDASFGSNAPGNGVRRLSLLLADSHSTSTFVNARYAAVVGDARERASVERFTTHEPANGRRRQSFGSSAEAVFASNHGYLPKRELDDFRDSSAKLDDEADHVMAGRNTVVNGHMCQTATNDEFSVEQVSGHSV